MQIIFAILEFRGRVVEELDKLKSTHNFWLLFSLAESVVADANRGKSISSQFLTLHFFNSPFSSTSTKLHNTNEVERTLTAA